MSLIIKGMDMPKSGESMTYSSKEIIEIPRPHGRLIDADYIDGSGLIGWQKSIVKAEISQAPTVVEAEVSE